MGAKESLARLAMAYPEILLAVTCFAFLFLRLGKHRRDPLTNWPLVGMLPSLLSKLHRYHDWATEVARDVGCTFLFKGPWFSGMNILITTDPANVNHIFNSNFSNYPKGEEFLEMFDVLGNGIFNADEESWKSQRKEAHALISHSKFRRFVATTSREVVERGLLPHLARVAEERSVVDLQDLFLRFTFEATCKQVFGCYPGCLSPSLPVVPFAKAMDDVEEVLFIRHVVPQSWWKLMRRLQIGEEKKMALAWETIDRFVENLLVNKMEEGKADKQDKSHHQEDMAADLLASYLEKRPEAVRGDVTEESKKFLRDTTVNLMLAGRDTTGSALTWFFWMISEHPDVEHKILKELGPILAKKRQQESCGDTHVEPVLFSAEDLASAVYLHAALYETLRLFPPVPQEHKAATHSDVLPSGHRVDPKMKIIVHLYAMGRIEGVWGKDCREFKPERWISERGRLRHEPSYKFLSFNSGPRTCLGKDMAFTQMKIVAAALIYNFRIRVVEGHVVAPKLSIILHMAHGLMVKVEQRTASKGLEQ